MTHKTSLEELLALHRHGIIPNALVRSWDPKGVRDLFVDIGFAVNEQRGRHQKLLFCGGAILASLILVALGTPEALWSLTLSALFFMLALITFGAERRGVKLGREFIADLKALCGLTGYSLAQVSLINVNDLRSRALGMLEKSAEHLARVEGANQGFISDAEIDAHKLLYNEIERWQRLLSRFGWIAFNETKETVNRARVRVAQAAKQTQVSVQSTA